MNEKQDANDLPPGRLRVSRIVYNCDISRADGRSIPLGVIADVRANHWYGLALSARKGVFDDELSCVGQRARDFVASPFEWLKTEFDRVFGSENPDVEFAQLCNVHSTSLMVLPMEPIEFQIPKSIATCDLAVQRGFLEDQVGTLVKTAYWDLNILTRPGRARSYSRFDGIRRLCYVFQSTFGGDGGSRTPGGDAANRSLAPA